jgi:hypothetical protein
LIIHDFIRKIIGLVSGKNSGKNQNKYQAHFLATPKIVVEIAIVRIPNPAEIMPSNLLVAPI